MGFAFIHAADLHIDSPLAGLGTKDAAVAERFAKAGRKAVENLVERSIADNAAFLIVAGDIFDRDWRDYSTGLFFVQALGKLHRAGLPTFIVKGNHDADSVMSRSLPYPDSAKIFASSKAETVVLDDLGVSIHGRSFAARHVPADFVASYPAPRAGHFNIGVLHTSLDGTRGHETYAACGADDLRRFGYDYWALGHIHAAALISSRHPHIVYPGNLQGRSIRETGPKGAMRVDVEDAQVVRLTPLVLDAARWAAAELDISACDDEAAVALTIETAIVGAHAEAEGRPLAMRISLRGTSALHPHLVAQRERLLADARAVGVGVADDCWIEQLSIESRAPSRAAPLDAGTLDIESLLERAALDESFGAELADLLRSVSDKMPRDLREQFLDAQVAALERIKAMARDHLVGVLASTAA